MDPFKKNLKYMVEKGKLVQTIIARVLLLSFFKQIDQHLCVKFAKNKNLICWPFLNHKLYSNAMANTKSAIKTIRRISRETKVNKIRKARFKKALKKMNSIIDKKK